MYLFWGFFNIISIVNYVFRYMFPCLRWLQLQKKSEKKKNHSLKTIERKHKMWYRNCINEDEGKCPDAKRFLKPDAQYGKKVLMPSANS